MITDQEIIQGCIKRGNLKASQNDVDAFRRFQKNFECEDAETYEEAMEKIQLSMRSVSEEIETTMYDDNDTRAHEILNRRLSGLRR